MFARNIRQAIGGLAAMMLTTGCVTTGGIQPNMQANTQSAVGAIIAPPMSQWLATCEKWDEWDKSGPPFQIHANTYYVGTCGIGAILIKGNEGHVLIDSGTEAGADVVLENIRSLGVDLQEIEIILQSHEHFDHVGGLAKLQRATGADVYASPAAAMVLSTGEDHPEDPQFGVHDPMKPVSVTQTVLHRDFVTQGDLTISAIATPGHTPGAMSWQWESCSDQTDDSTCRTIVYADSLSPVSSDEYRFSDHPEYLAAYRDSLRDVALTPCDMLITPHPSSSKMVERMASEAGLQDRLACARYSGSIGARLDERLAKEAEFAAETQIGN